MDTIHLKTVDPLSQELLKSASQRGIKLNWDRYERLQPQDGFLRVGLSCPYGCMQGPCRIDPFGRGPDRGFCGLDRDRMVAALLLRVVLNGTLEAMNEFAGLNKTAEFSLPPLPDSIFSRAEKKTWMAETFARGSLPVCFLSQQTHGISRGLNPSSFAPRNHFFGVAGEKKNPEKLWPDSFCKSRLRTSGAEGAPHRGLRKALARNS